MTRADFLALYCPPSMRGIVDTDGFDDALAAYTKALDALLAAARAEALDEAADPMEDDAIALEPGEVRRALSRHVRRIRALVKP